MIKNCTNCRFYDATKHRGQKYDKGFCNMHTIKRLSDNFEQRMSIVLPHEYGCKLFEEQPQPSQIKVSGGKIYLVSPDVAKDLVASGWVYVQGPEQQNDSNDEAGVEPKESE